MLTDLSSEQTINTLVDFSGWRFVRQTEWKETYAPSARCLPGAIVVGWSQDAQKRYVRLFYVVANEDVVDGLQLDPHEVIDPHGGDIVCAGDVACNRIPRPYVWNPDEVIERERERRSAHVAFALKFHQPKQEPKPEPKQQPRKPGFWSRLLGRS